MKLYKQVIALFFLFLALPSCSHKETLQWIPFIWEGDIISGRYIEKAFLYVPVEIEDLPAGKFELTDGPVKLPFRIDGKEYKLMFDTGSSPFQLVTTKERALAISDPAIVDSLSGPLWWGTEVAFCGLNVNKIIELGGQVLEDSKVYYEKNGLWDGVYKSLDVWGITGNAYFYDRILILDYKNKVFRVK